MLLSGPHPSIRPPKRTKHADRSPAHASHHRCSACCASFLQVGGLSSRPSALNFALTPVGLGLLGNKREVQFRLTTRFRDGSYYTNFDNTYVRGRRAPCRTHWSLGLAWGASGLLALAGTCCSSVNDYASQTLPEIQTVY